MFNMHGNVWPCMDDDGVNCVFNDEADAISCMLDHPLYTKAQAAIVVEFDPDTSVVIDETTYSHDSSHFDSDDDFEYDMSSITVN